jgi:Carboxypeptidase regulatory-like domain
LHQPLGSNSGRRLRGKLGFLKVASFVVFLACGSTEPIEKNLLLEGTVTDAANGVPIAGAMVSVGYPSGPPLAIVQTMTTVASSTSDSQGRYTLSYIGCVHEPWVSVGAPGYYPDEERVGCKPGTQTVNLTLTRDPSAP